MRYMVVTLALCLLVVSAYAGTYVENFDDGNFDGWEVYDAGEPGSEWSVVDGVLTCKRETIWMSDLLFGEEDWRNYSIECDARIVEPIDEITDDPCASVIALDLRVSYPKDNETELTDVTCTASGNSKKTYIWAWLKSEEMEKTPAKDFDFELGRWYRLKGVAYEDTFEFYLDGSLVASYTDDRIKAGRLGVLASGASLVEFDNVIITGADVPDNTDSLVDGDLLALMAALDRAYNAHDTEWLLSFFTDDATFETPPIPPFGKEDEREFLDWVWESWPSFSLSDPLLLASVPDKVGVTEHADLYSYPDNGTPIATPHICVKDFDGDKMTRLITYGDYWADELIQAGLMPPRQLGDMVPSFPLPGSEAPGLSPMEASAELMARLNSGDLQSAAKMIRSDVDVWFPFINRKASRSEFIDIYEQILGGFSDAQWETIRRVDMGGGWVYFEGILKGTNDGEFLGVPATGLPMEVKGGWVERYDENGLATYLHAHFDSLSMPGQEAPTDTEDFSNVFFIDLTAGLNMISLPLKPRNPYTARSLAEEIGATVVIKYDEALGRFVGFTPASSGDGFSIEGGKGYIVNVLEDKTFACTGATWTNEPSAEAAPPSMSGSSGWAFIVSVAMNDHQEDDYTVTVRNLRTGEVATDAISGGRSNAVFADLNRNPVIEAGDKVEIIIQDSANKVVAGPVTHQIGQDDIRKAFRDMVIPYGYARPEKTVLLQNYPNPFNPETWIPFHLSKEADVSVSIYDSVGRLVRSLTLGRKSEGIYVDKSKAAYWDGRNDSGETVASGIYYYSITAGDFSATRKMIVKK